MTTATKTRTAKSAPKFVAIQGGEYLISISHIVGIELTNGLDEITVSMINGEQYTVEESAEVDKIMGALDVI